MRLFQLSTFEPRPQVVIAREKAPRSRMISIFVAPPAAIKPTDEQLEQLDKLAQLDEDDWNAAQKTGTAEVIASYLKAHPNGNFCELAQATPDRLLAARGEQKSVVKTDHTNLSTQGSTDAGSMKLGDSYTYWKADLYSKQENQLSQRITKIDDASVEFNDGHFSTDLLGNVRVNSDDNHYGGRQYIASGYSIGKEWKTRYDRTSSSGETDTFEYTFRVVSRESSTIPAGTFDAYCVRGEGWRVDNRARRTISCWMASDKVPRYLAMEFARYGSKRSKAAVEYWREDLIRFDAG
jgi:hypothetical protein